MDGSWTSNFQAAIDVGFQLARPFEYGLAMDVVNGLDDKDCYLNMENDTTEYPGIIDKQIMCKPQVTKRPQLVFFFAFQGRNQNTSRDITAETPSIPNTKDEITPDVQIFR